MNIINYRDSRIDREFIIPSFSIDDTAELYSKWRNEVFTAMFTATEIFAEAEYFLVPCMLINGLPFNITEKGMFDNINNMLQYYQDIEDYEKCQKLVQIKDKFTKKSKS